MRRGVSGGARHALLRGITFVVIGTAFLLFNLGLLHSEVVRVWWPVLPIAVGAANLLAYVWRGPRGGGPYSDFA
jgi:hypothetical protein